MTSPFRMMAAAAAAGLALAAVPAAAQYSQDGGYWSQSGIAPSEDQWQAYSPPNHYQAVQPRPAQSPASLAQIEQFQNQYAAGGAPAAQYSYTASAGAQSNYGSADSYRSIDPYAAYRGPLWQQAMGGQELTAPVESHHEQAPAPQPVAPMHTAPSPMHSAPAPIMSHHGDTRIHALESEIAALRSRLDGPPGFHPAASPYDGAPCGDACTQPCCQPCCEGGLYGGVEFLFVKPRFEDCTVIIVDPAGGNDGDCADYDYSVTPRVWLGYQNCDGLGFRTTFWNYDDDMNSMSATGTAGASPVFIEVFGANTSFTRSAFAGVGETLEVESDLQLLTADFEVTQAFNVRRSNFLLGAGLRYARLDQHFAASATTAAGLVDELVINNYDFEGFGPTASLLFTRPFGETGLGFYTSARTSILFGERNQDIFEYKNTRPVGEPLAQTDSAHGDESLVIAELGIGLQYSRVMQSGTLCFVRGGYEGQIWFDAGNPVNPHADMVLEGLVLGFGVMR